jgi:fatty acid desaturase
MSASTAFSQSSFSATEAKKLVKDLFQRKAWVYWVDFTASVTVGYTAAMLYMSQPWISPLKYLFLAVAVAAIYRAGLFIHEIVHFHCGEMRGFKIFWNVVAGIPMLSPTFFYEPHNDHHNARHYGTEQDGEYLPLGHGTLAGVLAFLLQVFFLPVLVVLRFLFLTPISFLHPRLRQWTLESASSFVIDLSHRREIPKDAPRHLWALMDWACCFRAWTIFILIAAGLSPWFRVFELYLISVSILSINHVRTLAAHHYRNEGEKMSFEDQFFDSTIITGNGLGTEIVCPLGLRYHALHHLFPGMPYYNLGAAHRRLSAQLPADHPYHSVVYPSMWAVLKQFIQNLPQAQPSSRERPRGSWANAEIGRS